MIEAQDVKNLQLPAELEPFVGDYYKALIKRADMELLGVSEFKCFERFIRMYKSKKYRFAFKGMKRLFRFLSLLVFMDEDGKPKRLQLYPVQKFIMCQIFGLRDNDGKYIVNTANLYMARRNGKSFLLSGILQDLMSISRFKNELIILASCKGQNATICFNEFLKFIDNDKQLREIYTSINRTVCSARSKLTGNRLEMFRTGAGAKKSLDGFTNKVAVIDEEMLCDEIITKTIQDGQAHFKDSLLVTMSTAQFEIGGDNHKKWLELRKRLYEDDLPDNVALFLCEPDVEDIQAKDFANIKVWGKANPVLLFESDGYTIKEHIRKKYSQKAKEAMAEKGFALQSFVTKQCNAWYSAEEKNVCSYDQLIACRCAYSFEEVIGRGYRDWYIGVDLSQTTDLSSVAWCTYVGVNREGVIVNNGEPASVRKLYAHVLSWMPQNKLVKHVDRDKFCYYDYLDKELFLCTGVSGENIDIVQIFEQVDKIRQDYDLNYVCVTADPYNFSGVQDRFSEIADTVILQNQSPKSLSQYIEALSKHFKDNMLMYHEGHEDILEKAITNGVMVRNNTGYYSVEKISLRADSDIRIDPFDALLDAFIACYIDANRQQASGDELIDEWSDLFK